MQTLRLILTILALFAAFPLHAHRILSTAEQHWVSGILSGSSTPPPATDSRPVDSDSSSALTIYGMQYVEAESYFRSPTDHNRSSAGSFWQDEFVLDGAPGHAKVKMFTIVTGIAHGSETGGAALSFAATLLTPSLTQHFSGIAISAPSAPTVEEFLDTTVAVFDVVVGELWTIQAGLGAYAEKGSSIDATGFALTWFEVFPGYSLASFSGTAYRVVQIAEPDTRSLLSLSALALALVVGPRRYR